MLYEVKVYDGKGKLLNIVSPAELDKRSTDFVRMQLTERDKEHILSLEGDVRTTEMSSHCMVA